MPKDILGALSIRNDASRFQPDMMFTLRKVQDSIDIINQRIRAVGESGGRSNTLAFTVAGNWIVGKLTAVEIDAGSIVSGYIATTRLDILQLLVSGLTLTNNSPAAGRVAWSSCSVFYDGTEYTISSGSTASSSEKFIYWTVGGSTFTSAASFTPGPTVFLIATNTAGTADVAWNKLALSGVQKDNLVFGLIEGIAIQPLATATRSLTSAATTTIVSVSGSAGGFLSIGVIVDANVTGTPDVDILYQVDGATEQAIPLYDGSNVFDTEIFTIANRTVGDGDTIADLLMLTVGIGFSSSFSAKLRVNSTAATGQIIGTVQYGLATA